MNIYALSASRDGEQITNKQGEPVEFTTKGTREELQKKADQNNKQGMFDFDFIVIEVG